jgi:hypothetical protein
MPALRFDVTFAGDVCCILAAAAGWCVPQPAAAAGSGCAAVWGWRGSALRAVWATRHRWDDGCKPQLVLLVDMSGFGLLGHSLM